MTCAHTGRTPRDNVKNHNHQQQECAMRLLVICSTNSALKRRPKNGLQRTGTLPDYPTAHPIDYPTGYPPDYPTDYPPDYPTDYP